jgi:hypothetical protein
MNACYNKFCIKCHENVMSIIDLDTHEKEHVEKKDSQNDNVTQRHEMSNFYLPTPSSSTLTVPNLLPTPSLPSLSISSPHLCSLYLAFLSSPKLSPLLSLV